MSGSRQKRRCSSAAGNAKRIAAAALPPNQSAPIAPIATPCDDQDSDDDDAPAPTSDSTAQAAAVGLDEAETVDPDLLAFQLVTSSKAVLPSEHVYRMLAQPRGFVLIVNIKHFHRRTDFKVRRGSEVDVQRARQLFEQLGFRLFRGRTFHDLTKKVGMRKCASCAAHDVIR